VPGQVERVAAVASVGDRVEVAFPAAGAPPVPWTKTTASPVSPACNTRVEMPSTTIG